MFLANQPSTSVPISRGIQIRAIENAITHTNDAPLAKMNKSVVIVMLPPDPMNSLTDGCFTYHLDKYSCMKGMYEAHRKCASKSDCITCVNTCLGHFLTHTSALLQSSFQISSEYVG